MSTVWGKTLTQQYLEPPKTYQIDKSVVASVAKAMCVYNASANTLRKSMNVSSGTDLGTGGSRLAFNSAMREITFNTVLEMGEGVEQNSGAMARTGLRQTTSLAFTSFKLPAEALVDFSYVDFFMLGEMA